MQVPGRCNRLSSPPWYGTILEYRLGVEDYTVGYIRGNRYVGKAPEFYSNETLDGLKAVRSRSCSKECISYSYCADNLVVKCDFHILCE